MMPNGGPLPPLAIPPRVPASTSVPLAVSCSLLLQRGGGARTANRPEPQQPIAPKPPQGWGGEGGSNYIPQVRAGGGGGGVRAVVGVAVGVVVIVRGGGGGDVVGGGGGEAVVVVRVVAGGGGVLVVREEEDLRRGGGEATSLWVGGNSCT